MKKSNQNDKDQLRAEYKRSDFPDGFVRGKYAERLRKFSNMVVLRPEVAEVFPNEEAVNKALLSLIELAQKTTCPGEDRHRKVPHCILHLQTRSSLTDRECARHGRERAEKI